MKSAHHVHHLVKLFVFLLFYVLWFCCGIHILLHTFYALSLSLSLSLPMCVYMYVLIRLHNVLKPLNVLKQHPAQQPHQLRLVHPMCIHTTSKKLSMKSSVLVLTDLSRFFYSISIYFYSYFYFIICLFVCLFICCLPFVPFLCFLFNYIILYYLRFIVLHTDSIPCIACRQWHYQYKIGRRLLSTEDHIICLNQSHRNFSTQNIRQNNKSNKSNCF